MRTPIMNLDAVGVMKDMSPVDLPPNAFSDAKNVNFYDGKVIPQPGYRKAYIPTINPVFIAPSGYQPNYFVGSIWYVASFGKIYQTYKDVSNVFHWVDKSRAAGYNADNSGNKWQGGIYNGRDYMNNGYDVPQVFDGSIFVDLPNWVSTDRARSLRGFGNYMVALSAGSEADGSRVHWSHQADPGTYPSSWDITDATKDAGDAYLSDTPGSLIDQCTLGTSNFLYKSDAVHEMKLVGGLYIMDFKLKSASCGILATNCVCRFLAQNREMHFVLGIDDIYIHDGVSFTSLFSQRLRSWIFSQISGEYYKNSFVVNHSARKEIWICFTRTGKVWPDLAVVWNYEKDTTSIVDLPDTTCLASGPMIADSFPPSSPVYRTHKERLLMATYRDGPEIHVYEDTVFKYNSQPIAAMVERQGLALMGKDPNTGKPIPDLETIKLVTEVWPRIEGVRGTVVYISIGTQMLQQETVKWGAPLPFVIGVDDKVNPYLSGRLISIRFECTSTNPWKLNGYDLELVPVGKY